MKSTSLLIATLLLAAPTALLAQNTKPLPSRTATPAAAATTAPLLNETQLTERATALTVNMQKGLGLTPQQVEKVQKINLTSIRAVETARAQYRRDLRKMAGIVEDVGQSRLAALKDVLTPTQFDRYQRKREEKMGVPSGSAAQGNPAPGLPGGYGE
ncbi:hypothetical protein MUN82_04885 [Hymenobacter aerilatus]|uniref:Periplasmic heavy metal sensor n=1 Tax=Hymenobacter aerilatus TaxID=2932251 RepID=A0A8T9SYH2_9BACT|nr:hypothetical protein [Hymenobacter aerilatus]UOR06431.1 hypothetical protein MUN82_04885 [Hymenobacter aerilatus]